MEKDDLRPEYDFRDLGEGVRGKYHERYEEGANVVVIEPDLVKAFPNAKQERRYEHRSRDPI